MRDEKGNAATGDLSGVAREVGLRYVSDAQPGIRRKGAGSGFRYVDAKGNAVNDEAVLARIKSLAIPPAWTEVWICPWANGHIQATGRDARGRKQYRYHPRWRDVRDEAKYERMLNFARALPGIRKTVDAALKQQVAQHGFVVGHAPPRSVLSCCVSSAFFSSASSMSFRIDA